MKIVTFNCHGFKSVYDILLLCEQFDVIILQELWLSSEDISLLRSIHKAFEAYAVSAMNDQLGIQVGRPRKSISHACTICDLQDNRLLGIDIDTNDGKLFILNVYLPYQSSDNFGEFCNYLGKIASIIEEKDTSSVVITGDFNAAVNTPFESELIAMCENTGLGISDYEIFGRASNTYTYVSDAHKSTSCLDHFICSHSVNSMITDLYILDKCPSSDHLPVGLMISTALTAERCVNNEKHADKIPLIFRWSNAKDCNIKEYGKCSAVRVDRIHISDSCTCTNSNCSNRQHISDIDNLFDDICNALRVSSLKTITTCNKNIVPRLHCTWVE